MYWDIVHVEPLEDYRIHVELVGGRQGTFDMKPFLEHGVFRELKIPSISARHGCSWVP